MRVGDVTVDGQKVGWIDLALLEQDDLFPKSHRGDIGADAPLPLGTQQPDVWGRRYPSGPPDRSPSGAPPSRREDKEPTFRPGLTPRGKARPAEPPKFTTDDVQKAVRGERVDRDHESAKPRLTGSAYLKEERKWIADELKADPQLRRFLGGVLAHEQGGGERSKVAESLFNRLNMLRQHDPNLTLRDYLSRRGYRQFYGPIRRGEINERYLRGVDRYRNDVDAEIDKALGGSNEVKGFTDQGSRGDPNFGRERATGEFVYSHGELYGDMPGGAARRYRLQQQQRVAAGGTIAGTTTPDVPRGVTRLGAAPEEPERRAVAPQEGGGPVDELSATPGRRPNVELVDPRLREVVAAGAQHLPPGYNVTINEGYNPRGHVSRSQHHIAGRGALDVQIWDTSDPKHPVPIPNRGADTTGLYTRLARGAYTEMLARHPSLRGHLAWGGAFGTGDGSPTADLMHFDIGGERGDPSRHLTHMGALPEGPKANRIADDARRASDLLKNEGNK